MNQRDRIANVIRDALDGIGIELTWHDIYVAANAVLQELDDELEHAWRYTELGDL